LRKPQIVFPSEFDYETYGDEAEIIKKLLVHRLVCLLSLSSLPCSPEQRPRAEELIKMLPAKVEDSSVREMLNALSGKDTSAHTTLMQTIFGQVCG
jgi:hypothetical protein